MPKVRRPRVYTKAVEAVKNFIAPIRTKAPPRVRQIVKENEGDKIVSLQVGRNPLNKPLQQFLNVISLGKYEKARKKLGYDDIYHTYLVATMEDGRKILIEKNSQVDIKLFKEYSGQQLKHVPLKGPIALGQFMQNGERYFERHPIGRPQNYWKYDAATNNCQYFVNDLLSGNAHSLSDPESAKEFSSQDIVPIMGSLPGFAKSALELKQHIDHAVHGDGFRFLMKPKHPMYGQGFWGDVWKYVSKAWKLLWDPPTQRAPRRQYNYEEEERPFGRYNDPHII